MPDLRAWLAAGSLVVVLTVLREQIVAAVDRRACSERAAFELISCLPPPAEWQIVSFAALAIGLAVILGALLATGHKRAA